ncbi:MAG: galactokinase family protein, partial [Oscillospiraceae bacterium]|nr:galactokinase family protein [Oscillospiraceae bacterium]
MRHDDLQTRYIPNPAAVPAVAPTACVFLFTHTEILRNTSKFRSDCTVFSAKIQEKDSRPKSAAKIRIRNCCTRALTASGGCDMLSGQKLMKTEDTGMYQALKKTFRKVFGEEPTLLFSAPGRTELIGN